MNNKTKMDDKTKQEIITKLSLLRSAIEIVKLAYEQKKPVKDVLSDVAFVVRRSYKSFEQYFQRDEDVDVFEDEVF